MWNHLEVEMSPVGQARDGELAGLEQRSVQGELGQGQGGAQITAD